VQPAARGPNAIQQSGFLCPSLVLDSLCETKARPLIAFDPSAGFLRRFRDPIRVLRILNRVPRIREIYHRVSKIRENRVPRIREIGSLHIHTGSLTLSLKKTFPSVIMVAHPCCKWLNFSCMVSKFSDFWLCPLIINSHLIKACICFRRKFCNQQNARHTAVVHYTRKHLRYALQLLFNFKTFQLSYTYAQHSRAAVVRLDFIVNWHVYIQTSLEVSLCLKLLVYWRDFY